MMERVNFTVSVLDGNIIEIIPEGGVKDNSIYEVKLIGIKEDGGSKVLPDRTMKLTTALKPAYVDLQSVWSLVESTGVPEDQVLYAIREASKYADYIKGSIKIDVLNIPFEVQQFVRYRAAMECLMKFYIDKASTGGSRGQMGDVMYEETGKVADISGLIDDLRREMQIWLDAVKGYKLEGRAKPLSALRGNKALTPPIMSGANAGIERGV